MDNKSSLALHAALLLGIAALAAACSAPQQAKNPAAPVQASAQGQTVLRDCEQCPALIEIPAGTFTMGSPTGEPGHTPDEGPQRSVHINRLAVGKFDVTRGEWRAFASATNRRTVGGCSWSGLPGVGVSEPNPKASWETLGFQQDDAHPVVCVTWQDTQDYIQWLSKVSGHPYRLLTEAEWEYAARAATATPYPWGANPSHAHANYGAETCCGGAALGPDRWVETSPAGAFPPNPFGLHDMHGNVMQWVQDCFSADYAATGTPADGSAYQQTITLTLSGDLASMNGTSSCAYRMARGGDWGDPPAMIRSAYRNFAPPPGSTLQDYKSAGIGFRVARSVR